MVDKEARPSELEGSSRDLGSIVTQFRTDLQRLEGDFNSAGEPWGGDLLGMLIGEAHGVGMSAIFELYNELSEAMGEDADDLTRLAGNHRNAETTSNDQINDVGNQLV